MKKKILFSVIITLFISALSACGSTSSTTASNSSVSGVTSVSTSTTVSVSGTVSEATEPEDKNEEPVVNQPENTRYVEIIFLNNCAETVSVAIQDPVTGEQKNQTLKSTESIKFVYETWRNQDELLFFAVYDASGNLKTIEQVDMTVVTTRIALILKNQDGNIAYDVAIE